MATTSTTITFSTETSVEGASVDIDLDEEKNNGNSRFLYGTSAHFRVFKHPDSLNLTYFNSDGTLSMGGDGTATLTETITFANVQEGSTRFAILGIVSYNWFGNSLGVPSAAGGKKVTVPTKGVGVLEIKYTAKFRAGSLSVGFKPFEEYPVLVHVIGA